MGITRKEIIAINKAFSKRTTKLSQESKSVVKTGMNKSYVCGLIG
jgi:hypothetical protein